MIEQYINKTGTLECMLMILSIPGNSHFGSIVTEIHAFASILSIPVHFGILTAQVPQRLGSGSGQCPEFPGQPLCIEVTVLFFHIPGLLGRRSLPSEASTRNGFPFGIAPE